MTNNDTYPDTTSTKLSTKEEEEDYYLFTLPSSPPPYASVAHQGASDFQNLLSLGLAILVLSFTYYDSATYIDMSLYLILLYSIADIPLSWGRHDIVLHHVFCILCATSKWVWQVDHVNNLVVNNTCMVLIYTEISSIFLSLSGLFRSTTGKSSSWLNMIFVATFIYFRIIKFSTELTFNPAMYSSHEVYFAVDPSQKQQHLMMTDQEKMVAYIRYFVGFLHFNGGILGLQLLNLYWLQLIMKKLYRTFLGKVKETDKITAESILRFTYFVNPLICIYLYMGDKRPEEGIYEVFAQLLLSGLSYNYHHDCYWRLLTEAGRVPDGEAEGEGECECRSINFNMLTAASNRKTFVDDQIGIHIRSFVTVFSFIHIRQRWTDLEMMLLGLSTYIHLLSIYFTTAYLCIVDPIVDVEVDVDADDQNQSNTTTKYELVLNYDDRDCDRLNGDKIRYYPKFPLAISIGIAIATDALILVCYQPSITGMRVLFTFICILLSNYVGPFYHYNHVYLHVLLMIFTFTLTSHVLNTPVPILVPEK